MHSLTVSPWSKAFLLRTVILQHYIYVKTEKIKRTFAHYFNYHKAQYYAKETAPETYNNRLLNSETLGDAHTAAATQTRKYANYITRYPRLINRIIVRTYPKLRARNQTPAYPIYTEATQTPFIHSRARTRGRNCARNWGGSSERGKRRN